MVKVISLSNEAYKKLKALKKNAKSFSDVVIDLIERKKDKRDIMKYAGVFANDEEWKIIMDEIIANRKNIKMREVKF